MEFILKLFTWPLTKRAINAAARATLRSPLHGLLSWRVMLITFTGRKTGKRYTTPVDYVRDGGMVLCFTDGRAGGRWWKNMIGGAPVTLRIRGRDLPGHAEACPDSADVQAGMRRFIQIMPQEAAIYGVHLDSGGQPDEADLERAAPNLVLIRVALDEAP